MKNFKKITACVIALIMMLSCFSVFAEGGATYDGTLGLKSYFWSGESGEDMIAIDTTDDDINNDVAFVGEYIFTDLYFKNTSNFSATSFAIHFNPEKIKLYSYEGNTEAPSAIGEDSTGTSLFYDIAADSSYDGVGAHGVIMKKDAVNDWDSSAMPTCSPMTYPILDNVNGLVSVGLYALTDIGAPVTDAVAFYQMKFKALNAGNADEVGLEFATDGVMDTTLPEGFSVAIGTDAGGSMLNMKTENATFEIKEKPDTPASAALTKNGEDYTASWDEVASRGYIVTLKYKSPEGVESDIDTYSDIDADTTSCVVTGIDKPGSYYITVVAKGKDNNSDAVTSSEIIVSETLETPDSINLTSNGKYEWNAVENASSYDVDIYEVIDGTPTYVKTVNVPESTIDMKQAVSEVGLYQITVKPKGDEVYYITPGAASDYSDIYSNGTTATGYIQLLGLDNAPLTGANITCEDVKIELKQENVVKYQTNAAKDGKFEIKAIVSGTYDIVITKKGALTTTFTAAELTGDNFEISTSSKPVKLEQGETAGDGTSVLDLDLANIIRYLDKSVSVLPSGLSYYDFNQDNVIQLEDFNIALNNYRHSATTMTFEAWKQK